MKFAARWQLYSTLAATLVALPAMAAPATYLVTAGDRAGTYVATGTVEALRQGTLGAQVSGRVLEVLVRSGDAVKAGQPLIRIEADEVLDAAMASNAAASGARARLASVSADYERAQRLQSAGYISVAALQRAEAALRSAEAEAQAAGAVASGARTRANWSIVTAPYAGVVTDVRVTAGDLATPGLPLALMYDPRALRVVAQLPESVAAQLLPAGRAAVLGQAQGAQQAPAAVSSWVIVSAVDAATHSITVRAELSGASALQPGQFVRLALPLRTSSALLRIPASAVVHRSEVTAVYVLDAKGALQLRQVRLGPLEGEGYAVLAGLAAGERIATEPLAAAGP